MSEVLAVTRGEHIQEVLCPDTVDRCDEVGIGDGGVTSLDALHWFAQCTHLNANEFLCFFFCVYFCFCF